VQTLTAAAGEPDIKSKLLKGYDAAGKTFRVHLDGYDQSDMLAGKGPDPRREFFYWTDDGNFAGLRPLSSRWQASRAERGICFWRRRAPRRGARVVVLRAVGYWLAWRAFLSWSMTCEYRSDSQGDNLFLSSIVALNADTGAYVWHYRRHPERSGTTTPFRIWSSPTSRSTERNARF
jgi:hypothetical protein